MQTKPLRAVDRAIRVLWALDDPSGLSIGTIAARTGLSKSVVHRILASLEQCGVAIRAGEGYIPGLMSTELARRVDPERVIAASAADLVRDISVRMSENVHISIIQGTDAKLIVYHASTRSTTQGRRTGVRLALYTGAAGRVLLAGMLDDELERYLRTVKLIKKTTKTNTDVTKLRDEIEATRKHGYSIAHEETQLGMSSIAVPIVNPREECIASISLSALTDRMMVPAFCSDVLRCLRSASRAISRRLYCSFDPGGEEPRETERPHYADTE